MARCCRILVYQKSLQLARLQFLDQFQESVFETNALRQQSENTDLLLSHLVNKFVDLSLKREFDVDRSCRFGWRLEVFESAALKGRFDFLNWSRQINFRDNLLVLIGHFLPDRFYRPTVLQVAQVEDRHRVADELDFLKQMTVGMICRISARARGSSPSVGSSSIRSFGSCNIA